MKAIRDAIRPCNTPKKVKEVLKEIKDKKSAQELYDEAVRRLDAIPKDELKRILLDKMAITTNMFNGITTIAIGNFAKVELIDRGLFYEAGDLFVGNFHKDYSALRNRGIARLLFDTAIKFSKARKKEFIIWTCSPELVPLYEKLGAKVFSKTTSKYNPNIVEYRMKYVL